MNKMVGLAEFKANCLKLIAEMQQTGEPITLTRRGKPVAELAPVAAEAPRAESLFGLMRGSVTFAPEYDPSESLFDSDWEAQWEANNPPEQYSK